jgi:hypothetical protein
VQKFCTSTTRGELILAGSFIQYWTTNGIQYARIRTPKKVNGKKCDDDVYLGRVIDKDAGIFTNRKEGTFHYSLKDGYSASDVWPTVADEKIELTLEFGDVFALHTALIQNGIWDMMRSIMPKDKDTLCAMVMYRVLRCHATQHAASWYNQSIVRLLCPDAKMESQRLSEFLSDFGKPDVERLFYAKYLPLVCGAGKVETLIDSTGMPNRINSHYTAVNNHNGLISLEARMVLVSDRTSGLPLCYHIVPGNVVDVSTLRSSLRELKEYGVNIDMTIMDAGYLSEDNIDMLISFGIRFMTRLKPNLKSFKKLVDDHFAGLKEYDNSVIYGNRVLYIKKVPTFLYGANLFLYLVMDCQKRFAEQSALTTSKRHNKRCISYVTYNAKMRTAGLFALISSENLEIAEVMPLYYSRQGIEQIFDVFKTNVGLLPLATHNEATLRGHLLLTFIAAISHISLVRELHTKEVSFGVIEAFDLMNELKCNVFKSIISINVANAKQKDIAGLLSTTIPETLALPLDPTKLIVDVDNEIESQVDPKNKSTNENAKKSKKTAEKNEAAAKAEELRRAKEIAKAAKAEELRKAKEIAKAAKADELEKGSKND